MARTRFVLCSAPHGGRYARIDETSGKLIQDIERSLNTTFEESKFSEFMPITVKETVDQIKTLYNLGVRFFHDHAFDQSGIHSTSGQFYDDLESEIRKIDPEIIHSVASSNRRGAGIAVLYNIVQELENKNIDPVSIDPNDSYYLNIFIRANLERFKGSQISIHPDTITTITNLEYSVASKIDSSIKPRKKINNVPLLNREQERLFNATHPELIKGYYQAHLANLQNTEVNHEIEVSTMKAFEIIETYFENNQSLSYHKIGSPTHFVILFNFTNGLRLSEDNVKKVLDYIKKFKQRNPEHKIAVTFGLVMLPSIAALKKRNKGDNLSSAWHGKSFEYTELDYRELIELTLKHDSDGMVGCFRVGTEDTPTMYGKQRDDEFFIREVLEIFNEYNLTVETNSLEARKVFNLPPRGEKVTKKTSPKPPTSPNTGTSPFDIPFTYDDPEILVKYDALFKKGYGPLIDVITNPYFEVGEDDFEEFQEKTSQALQTVLLSQPAYA